MLRGMVHSILWLVLLGVAMGGLERIRPANPKQRFLRPDFITDLIYWLSPCFLYGPLAPRPFAALAGKAALALTGSAAIGFAVIARQPFWAQAVEAFLLADFLSYWAHRAMHKRGLWAFHAVHHGAAQVDWLTSIRNHPVNVVMQRLVLTAPLLLLGFPAEAIIAIAPVSAVYNIFVHANLDWRFGPLDYLFVSPGMHRWHHSAEAEGCNSNYGEALAIWDVIFGTFRLPEAAPERLGLDDGPPADFLGQTWWPAKYFLAAAKPPEVELTQPATRA
jgi:sterol desaturase/sphingolipid hydroxylase (fatty acid hydroxylase superfamily)